MSSFFILFIIVTYFLLLMAVSFWVSRKKQGNDAFFLGNRQSPWYLVSFGMLGASISGISFVSVPGMVRNIQFSYLQMVLGFFFGYLIVAYLLLPLFYRLNLTTIYGYLNERFGRNSYKTGSSFFVLAKMVSAAAKLYVVALVLQNFIFEGWGIPFYVTTCCIVFLIWLYTFRGGIRSLVWTDSIQTFFLLLALILILLTTMKQLDFSCLNLLSSFKSNEMTRVFIFDDWHSRQNFFKQFLSGIFVVIAMTGLDQDMMQKNLSCRSLKESQKNMLVYGSLFLPINFLFLLLGFLLLLLAQRDGITLPLSGDEILPFFAASYLGETVTLFFLIGMIAASFSSADSALTSVTTSVFVDLLELKPDSIRLRKVTHFLVCLLFCFLILIFNAIHNKSVIDLIYTIVGYVYGPLLGMFAFGLLTKRLVKDCWIPFVVILSPFICFFLDFFSKKYWHYSFGYELLIINGILTFVGLLLLSRKSSLWK